MRCVVALTATLLAAASFLCADEIPSNTVVPVMLTVTIDSGKAYVGQSIAGKVMENVPLAAGDDIPAGAKVYGHVALVIPSNGSAPSSMAVQFDRIVFRGHDIPV